MAKRIAALALCAALIFTSGCSSLLNGEVLSVERHDDGASGESSANASTEVETYGELVDAIHELVDSHIERGIVRSSHYGGSLEADVERACQYVYYEDPLGAYALYYITGTVTRIVSYYEIEITATYKRSAEQISQLLKVSSLRYLQAELLDRLTSYSAYCAMETGLPSITAESVSDYLTDCYYRNPIDILVMPKTEVTLYPETGSNRIVEVSFTYDRSEQTLLTMTQRLQREIQKLAGQVTAETDGGVLLELCTLLSRHTEFDTATANDASFTRQDMVATAYGAMVDGLAVGEGYAMAYKAMCDEFGIECSVVTGRLNGRQHSWNIVRLDGEYYHIDVAMCDENGVESAFLLRDSDMQSYWWDSLEYKECNGTLTYADIAGYPVGSAPGDEE